MRLSLLLSSLNPVKETCKHWPPETTGTDIAQDRIVELAATHSPSDGRAMGSSFSTVVKVDAAILEERGAAAELVHGISPEEVACGPSYEVAWERFSCWIDALLNEAVVDGGTDTDDEDQNLSRVLEEPILVLAAHNGVWSLECIMD